MRLHKQGDRTYQLRYKQVDSRTRHCGRENVELVPRAGEQSHSQRHEAHNYGRWNHCRDRAAGGSHAGVVVLRGCSVSLFNDTDASVTTQPHTATHTQPHTHTATYTQPHTETHTHSHTQPHTQPHTHTHSHTRAHAHKPATRPHTRSMTISTRHTPARNTGASMVHGINCTLLTSTTVGAIVDKEGTDTHRK